MMRIDYTSFHNAIAQLEMGRGVCRTEGSVAKFGLARADFDGFEGQ